MQFRNDLRRRLLASAVMLVLFGIFCVLGVWGEKQGDGELTFFNVGVMMAYFVILTIIGIIGDGRRTRRNDSYY